jgi:signal transduction histidine kinase
VLRIRDDGAGFDKSQRRPGGMGLRIMEYRARELGGQLTISSAQGTGTCVECIVPECAASLESAVERTRAQAAATVLRSPAREGGLPAEGRFKHGEQGK